MTKGGEFKSFSMQLKTVREVVFGCCVAALGFCKRLADSLTVNSMELAESSENGVWYEDNDGDDS